MLKDMGVTGQALRHAIKVPLALAEEEGHLLGIKWQPGMTQRGGPPGTPGVTVEPSGGVVGLNQRNADEGGAHLITPLSHAHWQGF